MKVMNEMVNPMETPSKKPYTMLAMLFVIIGVAFIVYRQSHLPLNPSEQFAETIVGNRTNQLPTPVIEPQTQPASVNTEPLKVDTLPAVFTSITAADISKMQGWSEEYGYYSAEDGAIYESYSDAILEDLAKKGDIKALDTLGNKFIQKGEMDKAVPYFWEAAALGSTTALDSLAILAEPNPTKGETKEMRKELFRGATLESLALYQVVALRGDENLAKLKTEQVKSSYDFRYGQLELTPQELQTIVQRKQEIYSQLQARRTELGLNDFNNSVPAIRKYMNESIKYK